MTISLIYISVAPPLLQEWRLEPPFHFSLVIGLHEMMTWLLLHVTLFRVYLELYLRNKTFKLKSVF